MDAAALTEFEAARAEAVAIKELDEKTRRYQTQMLCRIRRRAGRRRVVTIHESRSDRRPICADCRTAYNLEQDMAADEVTGSDDVFYCEDCWSKFEECTDPLAAPEQQFARACFGGVDDVVHRLFDRGVDVSTPVKFNDIRQQNKVSLHTLLVTPLAAACMGGRLHWTSVERLLYAGADHKTPVRCLSCSADCGLHGKTPAAIAHDAGMDTVTGVFERFASRKRKRRTTPVKDRAAKLGIDLPPTPHGIRQDLASEDVERQRKAKRRLQRHQKACHQVVDRAEKEQDYDDHLYYRRRALDAQVKARSYRKAVANLEK